MRAEVRRRAEQDHVDAAGEQLLVGVEADEAVVGSDVDLRADLLVLLQVGQALLEPSSKASAMATSLTLGSAASAWVAAPVPRSPQPTRPTRSRSLPAA